MKQLTTTLTAILLIPIGLVLFIIILPFIIISMPIGLYNEWSSNKDLKKYINELGDKNFFCYNNRTDCKDFIENEIVPKLDKTIELIYLDGKDLESTYNINHISLALYKLKNYTKFPHLLKFRNGQMIDESVNNEMFNTMNQNKPLNKLLNDINGFFELREN